MVIVKFSVVFKFDFIIKIIFRVIEYIVVLI